ncbi:hypothetical protein CMI37_39510 [Candidatus Pacearchaeota archaeon]|nr:hypothetical protein [Candidatus Pacearchaeota archaeon]
MKLTKQHLKQIIKEELQKILELDMGQEFGDDISATALPTGDLEKILADVQKCLADGGLMVAIKCGPIALQLITAIADEEWIPAMKHAMDLMECVPGSCKRAVQSLIQALPKEEGRLP